MENIDIIWIIFGVIAAILLVVFWRKRNAVWGGLTLGIIVGAVIAIIFLLRGSGFDWYAIGKGAISGALLGFGVQMLGKISDYIKNKQRLNRP